MSDAFLSNFSLLDPSAYVVIFVIVLILGGALGSTIALRSRYHGLSQELRRNADGEFRAPVLLGIVRDTVEAVERGAVEVNTQAIVEHNFQTRLKGYVIAERFVKASTGLLIILGLVGTFYGLTLSIGRLVGLVSADAQAGADLATGLTQGLTQALSGMSVAFTTSLFGIVSAIVMTLVGVFANVTDSRLALMVEIEAFLDNRLSRTPGYEAAVSGRGDVGGPALGSSVAQLQQSVGQFDSALQTFAANTRDFREFNLHLKDNVQRLSLSFADLSNTLNAHVAALQRRERERELERM
ncbi:MAG: hypothetical protein ABW321_02530 [Polyangiales bacterium]